MLLLQVTIILLICNSDPRFLKKGSIKRPSMSQYLPPSWPKSGHTTDRLQTLSSSSMSAYSTCSSGEADVFTSSESDEAETDESTEVEEEEGESRLTISEYLLGAFSLFSHNKYCSLLCHCVLLQRKRLCSCKQKKQ